jgi:Fe2+ transport system protein B
MIAYRRVVSRGRMNGGCGGSGVGSVIATAIVVGLVLVGVSVTLAVAWVLSKTALRGVPSQFTLELPPYRKPQIGRTLVRSMRDKAWFVLRRAIIVAAPAGVITWILGNIMVGDLSILAHAAGFLEPFGQALGLDGYILMAFIFGTTIYTIARETKSTKWTLAAVLIPTSLAIGATFLVAQIVRALGWV